MVRRCFERCREQARLSLSEAAEQLGVTDKMLAKVEEGEVDPDALLLRSRALVYRCTGDELLGLCRN